MEIFEKAKEKPDTAATVSDSEQENTCEDVPADIIPEKSENVKPVIPNVVKEACRAQIDYLKILIAVEVEQAIIDKRAAEMKEIIDFLEENKEGVDE